MNRGYDPEMKDTINTFSSEKNCKVNQETFFKYFDFDYEVMN